jgi:hypothetical protein
MVGLNDNLLVENPAILHFVFPDQLKSDSGWLEMAQIAFQGVFDSLSEKLLIAGNGERDVLRGSVGIFGVNFIFAATPHELGV